MDTQSSIEEEKNNKFSPGSLPEDETKKESELTSKPKIMDLPKKEIQKLIEKPVNKEKLQALMSPAKNSKKKATPIPNSIFPRVKKISLPSLADLEMAKAADKSTNTQVNE